MDPPLHPYSIILLVLVPSFFISNSVSADVSQYNNCSAPYSCGVVKNVTYPFWGDNRADYCGHPDFQLKCDSNVPKLIGVAASFRILSLNFSDRNMTVARDDYWDTNCPSDRRNNSLDPSIFKLWDGLQNMALLYDCINSFSPGAIFETTNCQDNSGKNLYYGNESLSNDLEGVCSVVIMPLFETYFEEVYGGQISLQQAIKDGFGMSWGVNIEECDGCVNSGGQCGYSAGKFTCFCPNGSQGDSCASSSGSSSKLGIIIGVSASCIGIVIILIVIIWNRKRCFKLGQTYISNARGKSHDHHQVEIFMQTYGTWLPRRFTYSQVKRMTKSFTTKIGQGGYGIVYKAIMPDGRVVAVKVLSESKSNGEEFINEVASISRTSHVNIVSLLGFCYEKNKRALIYEFMTNGSLDKFIHKGDSSNAICDLEWLKMYQIAIGIARGLEYLHQGCNTRILHLDIKPQNILLDEDFCPKISDFGLAKICQKKESIVSIFGTRGTIGYIAPEVFSRSYGGVSYKSDVYSYGMLVLEMIGGRKNFESSGGSQYSSEMYFPDWIYKELEECKVNMCISEEENEVIRKMTLVSLWCIQVKPSDRPSMNKVVEMLEGDIQSLPFPPKPSLCSPQRTPVQFSDVASTTLNDSNSRSNQKD
ncbi:LEAF RUST 10 DISEASE-RESISTANCE LOCUS RECEPTOR-LIKE PROTEIN KINASE-like 2.1 [Senna tora]|uniref:non-specific serine/threonine protein kinase n=1 Tax=Senna tora TaxID=362788 RepID=A0A834TF54_9FABA|nr:LEAF RUST 10 DISEASE-RESISTANCE LOCUS RECEPTOR-LIKE PROTEIN KINASE-like 2.1 [Senna tora]